MPASSKEEVAARLRAVMKIKKIETVQDLADLVGANRSAASNWLQAYVYPPHIYMAVLKDITGITLDWLYSGDAGAMPYDLFIYVSQELKEQQSRSRGAATVGGTVDAG